METKEFHNVMSIEDAKKIFYGSAYSGPRGEEKARLEDAHGRVISRDVYAGIDVPSFMRAQRDGYAVSASDTFHADEENPVKLEVNCETVHAGAEPKESAGAGRASRIATGAPLPRGANAVVMVEHTSERDGIVDIRKPAHPSMNVMHAGQDIMQGELVIRKGTVLGFRETGMLAALGMSSVFVYLKPRVAVISTGNEIVEPGNELAGGKIYDTNSRMIADACRENGCVPEFLGIAGDDEDEVGLLLEKALSYDAAILSGGTSAGALDVSYRLIEKRLEPGIVVHGVAIKPGKPVVLALSGKKPVLVLPGFPSSAIVTFNVFARPLLRSLAGLASRKERTVHARLAVRHMSDAGKHEFVLSHVVEGANGGFYVYPILKSSGAISSFCLADGYFEVPRGYEYFDADEEVDVVLISEDVPIADLVFIGSQCMGADIVLGMIKGHVKTISVGSSAGLSACERGEADVAGMHLLDKNTGKYNAPFTGDGLALVRGYRRKQGIMFREGLRHGSLGQFLEDRRLRFINRNNGSGTRILFEMLLEEYAKGKGIDADALRKKIEGYDTESKSHNAVASAVATKKADWGVGIYSAARMYGLEFIELRDEEYDFCIPKDRLEKRGVKDFISVLKSREFQKKLESLPGFVVPDNIGETVH